MSTALPVRVRRLIHKFLGDHGTTPVELRKSVFDRAHAFGSGSLSQPPVPSTLVEWVDTLAVNPSAITDSDVERLTAAGYSEDDIIEVTEAAALGASMARLEIAYRVTGEE